MMDRISFVAPVRAKVLVVPLKGLRPEAFDRYFDQIRTTNDIRLLDVSPIPECRFFNPQAFPQGRVFYDFSTNSLDEETAFLHDFEPFRKTLVVIGVGEYSNQSESAVDELRIQFPAAIVHNCIYFNSPLDLVEQQSPGTYYLTSLTELSITAVETTICGVTRHYLHALDDYASSFENITLRSPVSLIDGNVLTRTINYAQKRLSSGSSFKVSFSNGQDTAKSTELKLRTLQRQTGRHSKLMGNFFLLAGRCNDALQYFTDAAINSKKSDDYLWLASALEGLAVSAFVLSYLGLPFHVQNPMLASILMVPKSRVPTIGVSNSRVSNDSLATKSSTNITSPRNSSSSLNFGLYPSTLTGSVSDISALLLPEFLRVLCLKTSQYYQLSAAEIEDCVPDVVYVESLIRNIKLMITMYLASSEPMEAILESVIKSTPIALSGTREVSVILKSDIVQEIDKVFSLQLMDLAFVEQCRVYSALASIYSDLGLYRKQAFILRILLVALLPKVARMEKQAPVAEISSWSSINSIFLFLFQVYRIDIEPESNESMAKEHMSDWSTLQILLIKICLRIAEALQDYETLAKLCVLTFTRYSHCLLGEDQIKLKQKLNWLNLLLENSDTNCKLPYPDPFMVRNIKFVVASSGSDLVPFSEVEQVNGSSLQDGAIIFNPFKKSRAQNKEKIICENEVHQLKISLQNPFPYEVELNDVAVFSGDEVKVETIRNLTRMVFTSPLVVKGDHSGPNGWGSSPRRMVSVNGGVPSASYGSVVLPPSSMSQIIISFKALNPGQLTIKGLKLKAGNSRSQLFLTLEYEKSCGLQKIKKFGIQAPTEDGSTLDKLVKNLSEASITHRVKIKELRLSVIPRQPSLSVIKNLVTNGWIMLLEGEKQRFSLELRNTSIDPVNYLSFSFWDSTSDAINSKLAQPGVYSAEDVYELEWLLIKNRPFSVLNKQEISLHHKEIEPKDDFRIDYEINGKRGMTDLKIILEYSKKNISSPEQSYMKTISVPLNVSIQPSLEIVGCDVIPFFSSSLHGYIADTKVEGGIIQRNMNLLLDFIATIKASNDEDISAYCLLILDVKNSWKHKLCAHITNEFLTGHKYVVNEVLDPSETCRFLLPVKRIGYDVVDTSKPIPSLRNKQFVKNYNISKEEEFQERRNFWIKSILLQGLSGRWNTAGFKHERSGVLDLRCVRLNTAMTNVLVYDSILIQHSVFADDGLIEEIEKENNEYCLQRERFYILKTKIINHTHESLSGVLRHVPFPVNAATKQDLSIEQKILFNGVLQKHIGKNVIKQGESLELGLGFMVLEKGRYEWGCVFDVAKEKGKRVVGREPVYINAS